MNYKPDNEGKYMALYAIGDLHLSFQSDKNMDHFGKVWRNHDMFWDAKKTERLNEKFAGKLFSFKTTTIPMAITH